MKLFVVWEAFEKASLREVLGRSFSTQLAKVRNMGQELKVPINNRSEPVYFVIRSVGLV